MADVTIQELRDRVHKQFDNLWRKAAGPDYAASFDHNLPRTRRQGSNMLRKQAAERVKSIRNKHYLWLAEQMGLDEDQCHFRYFSREQLLFAERILQCPPGIKP